VCLDVRLVTRRLALVDGAIETPVCLDVLAIEIPVCLDVLCIGGRRCLLFVHYSSFRRRMRSGVFSF